ncbi:integrase core domain-containing protein, partial [Streptomyces humidus]|uniref:integrase core domain-containing protein n=1 Tax=Streptomyces humidus TaxID=52259 RepID=UPI001E3A3609
PRYSRTARCRFPTPITNPQLTKVLRRPIESAQYTSFRLAEHLDAAGIAASIGSAGDAYDNALMESTIGLFKTELIKPRRPWKTLSEVELATAEYVDWYNHRRLHGEIGHVPPVEYEATYYTELTKPQVTTTT